MKRTSGHSHVARRNAVIQRLKRRSRELRAMGIVHLSLFGSLARGEARRGSDVDVLVQIDRRKIRDLLDYAGLVGLVEDIVGSPVDVARRERLRSHVAPSALADEIRVF